ncbi:CerR family C-terminal domain-containing protein [Pseudomonas yamanorum]|uniref:CerR family C-terminal domain-containing protein n=1 Tax=Pseudomonas yamanorum TaxID=515393 RepID=A0A7Y8K867_9PSED|nr:MULTISPECIES: CerR family C-terminal domain-containing protein [Pseudomonas]MCS3418517.1 AcrR family transcriptional regulator [Pseudomonas sp. BIGb0558]MCS3437883.1 AcrR family transcriptional regulator [Pseudomonas sp. BIGb0450]NWE14813.1 CerR family C-terminal domain-containing protein [Pseudomonas yamanorum]NWE41344.1 CerR family C-terminal domain-containing protein [Pseudomonas yamanorum]NWE79631.1 CerR family C-terminal domain-containing protein [Pseudomonas yamanorum]
MARHKPAAEGGYQRGEETRARIVEAAVEVFGERGYDGASTRDIANAAGVNAPAIQYYFDGKEGVYLACVEHLIALLWRKMSPSVEAAESALADPEVNDQALIEVSLGILGTVVSTIQDSPQTTVWRAFMDRHQAGLCPESATMAFEERFKSRIANVIRLLIARLAGLAVDDERTVIHSMALFTQGLAFRVQKPKLLSALNWTEVNQKEMELVRDVVLMQARFTLEGLVRHRDRR